MLFVLLSELPERRLCGKEKVCVTLQFEEHSTGQLHWLVEITQGGYRGVLVQ